MLLAFGCGTGKTIMAIAAAEKLLETGQAKRILILCPASLKYQWQDKIHEFTSYPREIVQVIDGDKKTRDNQFTVMPLLSPLYVIMSYDSTIHDYEHLHLIDPDMTICDEVSAIKSFKAMRSKRVKKLFKSQYRLGLTATPIENRPEELYSIMQWVDSTVLGRYDLFEKAYITRSPRGWVVAYKNLETMHKRMGDAMARKTRHDLDVRKYLPSVDEGIWTVQMDENTFNVYQRIAHDMLVQLQESYSVGDKVDLRFMSPGFDETTPDGKLMAMYMCMEMLLDHPDLIWWSAQEYERESPDGSAYAHSLWSPEFYKLNKVPKLERLLEELEILLADPDSKIIIVSKYKFMLGIIDAILDDKEIGHVKFTGDLNAKQKAKAQDTFTNDPDCKIFLTSYAGGYGLDLYTADYLINYDLPWSAGTQDQINSRHVRASSEFEKVYIRNMITVDSVEERKLRILGRKGQLLSSVIDGHEIGTVEVGYDYLRTHLEKVTQKVLTKRTPPVRIVSGG